MTRERIVAAAVETFARQGLAGASVRDIARQARIRVSSLYHYFPSKEALYAEVQERAHAHIRDIMLSVMAENLDLRAQARELETLDRIVEVINREVVLENVLESVLEQGMKLFPKAEKAVFLKFDHETRRTEVIAVSGYDAELFRGMSLSFEEAINGLTTNITVNRSEQCSRCNGAGDIGGPVVVCATCKGSGQVQRAGGRLRFAQECPDCGGTGRRRSPCSLCHGKGTTPKSETVKVRIPAGVDTGSRVKIPGKGQGGRLGAPPGDLHIITNVGQHKYFTRKGDNIYVTVPITVPEAALGAKIEVPTVDGKTQLRIPPGTQGGTRFRIKGQGVEKAGRRGDQYVKVEVGVPETLTDEQRKQFEDFASAAGLRH